MNQPINRAKERLCPVTWTPKTDMKDVFVSGTDKANGHPKQGDVVVTFPRKNERTLMAKDYFEKNYGGPL
jgi:hypothetical protein